MNEKSEIQFGLTRIPFSIRRSTRRTTVALTIEPPGKLVVTAPTTATIDKVNAIVRRKAPWVILRIRHASDRPPPPSRREFVSGETLLYLGRQYRLMVEEGEREQEGSLRGGWLHVPVATTLVGEGRRRAVRRGLVGWLKAHADLSLPARLGEVCREIGVTPPNIVVREQKKRWGSCDAKGTLRINWRIIQAPQALVDYVLVHELVHIQWPQHDRRFWGEVGTLMPDYEWRRRRLREIGPRLEW